MSNFLKIQIAAVIGSLADYLITFLLTEIFNCWYLISNGTGNICGGIIQFLFLKFWVFKEINGSKSVQATRFIFVFAGNILLSTAGVYVLTRYLKINYLISKTLVSVLLGVSYNYFLQNRFVFGKSIYVPPQK